MMASVEGCVKDVWGVTELHHRPEPGAEGIWIWVWVRMDVVYGYPKDLGQKGCSYD